MKIALALALVTALTIPLDLAMHAADPHNRAPLPFSLLRAFGVALSLIVTGTIVGLYVEIFVPKMMIIAIVLASLVVFASFEKIRGWEDAFDLNTRYKGVRDLGVPVVIAISVLAWSSLTEPWNFLVATSMDAGNYEVYGNFWASRGSLYMDLNSIAGSMDLRDVFRGTNTWVVRDDWMAARPSYLYGFPALLAVAAALFGTPGPSWVVMAILAAGNSWALFLLGKRFALPSSVAVAGVFLAIVTPIFAYYSKQIMSEPLALLGVLLLLFGILGSAEEQRPDPWFLASGLMLTLMSKLDALFLVLLLLAACVVMAAVGRWPTRERPTLLWGLAGAASTSVAGAVSLIMADPRYLGQSTIAARVPALEGMPFAETPLYGVLVAGASVAWVAIPLLAANRQLGFGFGSVKREPPVPRLLAMMRGMAGLGWIAFLYWLYALRPRGATLQVGDHDALNAVRLVDVHSEAGLFLIAALPVMWLVMRRNDWANLMVSIPLLVGLAYFVLRSNHHPAELWWMRRYLVMLMPLTILGVASVYRLLADLWSGVTFRSRISLAGCIGILTLLQIPSVALQQHHVQNPSAPRLAREVASKLDSSDILLIRSDSRIVRGVGMTGASLVGARVIPSVSDLDDWERANGGGGQRFLLTDHVLKSSDCGCEPSLVLAGLGEAQWASWQLAFRRPPHTYLRTARFWLYSLEGGE